MERTNHLKSSKEDSLAKLNAQLLVTTDTKIKKLIKLCIDRIKDKKKLH